VTEFIVMAARLTWSGRRDSNPRHPAWKVCCSKRPGLHMPKVGENCPVIIWKTLRRGYSTTNGARVPRLFLEK